MTPVTAKSGMPLARGLTEEKIQILISGLASLEGALKAIRQPVPEELEELKNDLLRQGEARALLSTSQLTTKQVALLLNCTPRRVRQLGQQRAIDLVQRGGQGRGHSNIYDAASVYAYLEEIEPTNDSFQE